MIDPSWVLTLMLKAEPAHAQSPWRASYEATAAAIARAADQRPLFAGQDGAAKTAAVLVSVAWFESRFQPDAEGDKPKLADGTRGRARSVCAMQVHESNFAALKVTRAELLSDVQRCFDTGLELLHVSFGVCRAQPLEHRLAHYCVGGNGCTLPTKGEDAHRMRLALALFKALPPEASSS
jgi:hypothetical protein